ncbi:conserved oligomeric Golgi complex subunit 4 [Physcia stellaris]|nr:conserved oligomeric Golgi complex subunit 4 [Physcia stellaris]
MSPVNGRNVTHSSSRHGQVFRDQDSASSLSIQEIDSITDVRVKLAELAEQESSTNIRLESLTCTQKDLRRDLGRLDLLRANLSSHVLSTRSLSNGMLFNAASTAGRISSAVQRLDLEQARVQSTLTVVEQVAELKACILGLTGSMGGPQDWETAAGYLSRASKIPKDIVNGAFAEDIVPTAEVPDPPSVTLEHASESLRGLFLREFEMAAQEGNGAKVTRFFKLFPLIGKPDVGLDVYGRYVCQGIASRARANLDAGTEGVQRKEGFFYANALTRLFEHIAQIVEHHGALVERHYGSGRMIKVIERLQLEADIQGGIVIDTWSDERNIDRRLTHIRSYAFTFLVQSFLPAQPARSGTPRAGSPAPRGSTTKDLTHDDENFEMKDIDRYLGEIALMLARWSLYSRFISSKCEVPTFLELPLINDQRWQEPNLSSDNNTKILKAPPLLVNSTLSSKISQKLIDPFNILTTFFSRRSVERAFQLDEQPAGLSLNPEKSLRANPPFITSAVDDVMYIVNQVVDRSLATSQRAVVSSVIPTVARILSSDFIGMIQRKMRDESYPKAAIQGAMPPEHLIIAFFVLINNLDIATDYVKRIVLSRVDTSGTASSQESDAHTATNTIPYMFPFDHDAGSVISILKSLHQTFESKASELISDGIFVAYKNIAKPRVRPVLADAFRDIDYQMTTDEIEAFSHDVGVEDGDQSSIDLAVQRQFQRGWDALTRPIARILTERNFDKLLSMVIAYLGEVLEKRIWSYYGRLNGTGAARLERDVASIVSVAVRGGRYGLRDAFARCTQICLIMNMEDDEWDEVQGASTPVQNDNAVDWKIDSEERLRARAMVNSIQR